MTFSKYNSALTEKLLRTQTEGQYLERKGRDTKHTKIADELIGMLNAGGGTLVYGIADDGIIEDLQQSGGLFNTESPELKHYRTLVHDLIKPPANIELEEVYLENGELVFLYHVEQDYERVFQRKDNEKTFLRVADENKGPLNRDEFKKLEYNKYIRIYEDELRPDFDAESLSGPMCESYRTAMRYGGSFEDLAIKRHLAEKRDARVFYKNAAILLFSEDPSQYIPNAYVRYVRYLGTEQKSGANFNVIKDERFEGNIPELIDRISTFINASLRDYYFLNLETGRFEKIAEFPREAWLEGIVNALCHRSYNLQGNAIYLKHFDDRFEISNSGPLPAPVTVENIRQQRYARNPRLARVLSDLGYVRELNEGVPRIYDSMKGSMLSEPVYSDENSTVTLTLHNKVSEHRETIHEDTIAQIQTHWKSLSDKQQAMLSFIFDRKEVTIHQLVDTVDITEQAVRHNLKKLENLAIVERLSEKQRDPQALYRLRNE